MRRTFSASVEFATELGQKLVVNVQFSPKPTIDSTIDELIESWAVCEGYEYLHSNNIPSGVFTDDGYFHERLLSIQEIQHI